MASLSVNESEIVHKITDVQVYDEEDLLELLESAIYGTKNGMEKFVNAAIEIMRDYADSHLVDDAKNDKALRICRIFRYNKKLKNEIIKL